jgi:ribosomal protein S4
VSLIPLWFISVYFGMALSREESEKMIKSGLVNVDNKQIRNPNKTIKKWQVVRLALPHPSSY